MRRTSAYMIRNDGKEFPITIHVYGNRDVRDVEETLFASEWLYSHTNSQETKDLVIEFLSAWVFEAVPFKNGVFEDVKKYLQDYWSGVKVISLQFLKSVSKKIDDFMANSDVGDLEELNEKVNDALNNEFLRARNGGMYDTVGDNVGEMYFRVSSTNGFNWFDIIWNFVYKHSNSIKAVTICKDTEALGLSEDYYYSHNGKVFNDMPVDDFLMMKGNPIVEKLIIS